MSFLVNFSTCLFSTRGRLRRALAGLGDFVAEKEEEQAPILKETECPVCLQVKMADLRGIVLVMLIAVIVMLVAVELVMLMVMIVVIRAKSCMR